MISKIEYKQLRLISYNPVKTAEELKPLLWPKPCRCGSIRHYLDKLEKRGLVTQQEFGYYAGTYTVTMAGEEVLAAMYVAH